MQLNALPSFCQAGIWMPHQGHCCSLWDIQYNACKCCAWIVFFGELQPFEHSNGIWVWTASNTEGGKCLADVANMMKCAEQADRFVQMMSLLIWLIQLNIADSWSLSWSMPPLPLLVKPFALQTSFQAWNKCLAMQILCSTPSSCLLTYLTVRLRS